MEDNREIWDEFRWEEFMKEQDKKVDRYMELFFQYQNDPDRDNIIAKEMGWQWLAENVEEDAPEPDEAEAEEGEEWKTDLPDAELSGVEDYKQLPVFQISHEFAITAMEAVEQLPEERRNDSCVVDFVSHAMVASAKIAGGAAVGNVVEELGGNIAYCKRGLISANMAISSLSEMSEKKILDQPTYLRLMEEAQEVRNAIALYILELRERFQRGVS
jgi:hypothetical protein